MTDGARPAPVGRVLGVEDSTPLQFWVAVERDAYLQLDDVVVTERAVPGVGSVTTSGVVTEVTARHEGAQFASDVFLIEDGVLPADVQEAAEVTTTRVDPELYVPPGAAVLRATGEPGDRTQQTVVVVTYEHDPYPAPVLRPAAAAGAAHRATGCRWAQFRPVPQRTASCVATGSRTRTCGSGFASLSARSTTSPAAGQTLRSCGSTMAGRVGAARQLSQSFMTA